MPPVRPPSQVPALAPPGDRAAGERAPAPPSAAPAPAGAGWARGAADGALRASVSAVVVGYCVWRWAWWAALVGGWAGAGALAALGAGAALLGAAEAADGWRAKGEWPVTLRMRRLRRPGGEMLRGSGTPGNPFTAEFNTLFLLIGDIADFAVMRHVGTDCPHLTQQEHWHARMHHDGVRTLRTRDACRRYWFSDLGHAGLRRMVPAISTAVTMHIEAASTAWLYYSIALPFTPDYADNLQLFHFLEEMEHGELTVHILRRRSAAWMRALTWPIIADSLFALALFAPLFRIIAVPATLLSPRAIVHLACFYLQFLPAAAAGSAAALWHGVLPFPESGAASAKRLAYCTSLVARRGIEFDVVGEHTYTVTR